MNNFFLSKGKIMNVYGLWSKWVLAKTCGNPKSIAPYEKLQREK